MWSQIARFRRHGKTFKNILGDVSDQLIQNLQEKALDEGLQSAEASARQSRIEKEDEEEDDGDSGSEVSYSSQSSSENG